MGSYDAAQICRNGHVVNEHFHRFAQFNQGFCTKCGAATMVMCDVCKTEIRGYYHTPGVVGISEKMKAPVFCYSCGRPFPWTESRLKAAKEIAREMRELTPEEQASLEKSLDDLVRDTPTTELSGIRSKKVMQKVGKESYEVMKTVISEVLSETAKKVIFPAK